MKHAITLIFLIIFTEGLLFSQSLDNTKLTISMGTQINQGLEESLFRPISVGIRTQKSFGFGMNCGLVVEFWKLNPTILGEMGIDFWAGPVYLGTGFIAPLTAGLSESPEGDNFLVKTGLELWFFQKEKIQVVINIGVGYQLNQNFVFNPEEIRYSASIGYGFRKRQK